MKIDGKNEVPRVKPVSVPLYPLQIPHELRSVGIRTSALRSRRLTS